MGNLRDILGEEDYQELQLKSLVTKVEKGDFFPELHTWLKNVKPEHNWSWTYTKYIIEHLQKLSDGEIKKLLITMPPRHGKLIADSTPVYTPTGWTTHGKLKPGDYVYHPSGKAIKVLAISPKLRTDHKVSFDTGEDIYCHGNHEWTVFTNDKKYTKTVETKWFLGKNVRGNNRKLNYVRKHGVSNIYTVGSISPLENTTKDYTIPPYMLGLWLADGSSRDGVIYHKSTDIKHIQKIESLGFPVSSVWENKKTGVVHTRFSNTGFQKELNNLDLKRNKHIPSIYLQGSVSQRLELLAGLIDGDGTVDKRDRVMITIGDLEFANQVMELCFSLGLFPYITETKIREPYEGSSIAQTKKVYGVGFQPKYNLIPTALPRKKITNLSKARRIRITNVDKIENGDMGKCIQVDSQDGLYLVGRTLIPTHNSELASVLFPAYFLEKDPTNRVIMASATSTLAKQFSRRVRSIVKERVGVDADRKAMDDWHTAQGGGLRAVGAMSGIAGVGANLVILDDVVKSRKDASSVTVRNTIDRWYRDDIYTRMEPNSRICVIGTLWNEDDLLGRIMTGDDADEWTIIKLPAIAEEDDLLGREVGEALNPERYPIEKLLDIKKVMGRGFSALYQCRPTEQEGEIFKASWFKESYIESLLSHFELQDKPRFEFVRYWDLASTTDGDWTVGILMAKNRKTKEYFIVDMVRGRWSSNTRDKIMKETAIRDQAVYSEYGSVKIRFEIQPGSAGKDMAKYMVKQLSGFAVKGSKITGSKESRADPFASQCEVGNVYVVKAEWNSAWLDELCTFPLGKHDDIVDGCSGAFSELSRGSSFISLGTSFLS